MTTLREQLIRFREFDFKFALAHEPNAEEYWDGAENQFAKDQKLFELLSRVAVGVDKAAEMNHATAEAVVQNQVKEIERALAALKKYVGGDGKAE